MSAAEQFPAASLSFVARDLPRLQTTTSTSSTSPGTSRGGLPTLSTTANTSGGSPQSFTTPAIGIPSHGRNPYINRTSQPVGMVFIAVGTIVAAILLFFVLYHLIKSLTASSLAKKTVNNEKFAYQKFAHNNNAAYGGPLGNLHSTIFRNTEYKGSVSKLPLVSSSQFPSAMVGPFVSDYSSSGLSDSEKATSRHDLTSMFISPTKKMTTNRVGSHALNGSTTNVSMYSKSAIDITHGPVSNTQTSGVPNYYMSDTFNNSQYDLTAEALNTAPARDMKSRNTIPSMYLEDLIDR